MYVLAILPCTIHVSPFCNGHKNCRNYINYNVFFLLYLSLSFSPVFVDAKVRRGIFFGSVHSISCYPLFYCVKPGYSRRHQSKRFTLGNLPSVLAWALANIRQNPPSAVPEDIGPRMKGLTDERKYIFALSVEFVSRGSGLLTAVRAPWEGSL